MSSYNNIPHNWDYERRTLYYALPPNNDGEDHEDDESDVFILGYRMKTHAPEIVRLHSAGSVVQQRSHSRDFCFDYPDCSMEGAHEWVQNEMAFNTTVQTSSPLAASHGFDLLRVLHPCKEAMSQVSSMMTIWENEE